MTTARLLILIFTLVWLNAASADPVIELVQDREAMLEDQRLVGNSRAQAKRRGTIRSVPQLFVYHTDTTAAYHVDGYRDDFIRFLDLAVRGFREERSMVDLDKLLERAHVVTENPDEPLQRITPDDLPTRDLIIVFYFSEGCEECTQVERGLADWLASNDDIDYNYLRVALD